MDSQIISLKRKDTLESDTSETALGGSNEMMKMDSDYYGQYN